MPFSAEELAVRTGLDHRAPVHHHQPVHGGDGREPVGDGDHGLAGHQPVERLLDRRLDLGVERAGRLVEDEDRRVLEEDAGDRDALPLAAGELDAALADMGVVAAPLVPVAELGDEGVGMGKPRGLCDLRLARMRPPIADVVADRAVEERGVLGDEADLTRGATPASPRRCPGRRSGCARPRGRRSGGAG